MGRGAHHAGQSGDLPHGCLHDDRRLRSPDLHQRVHVKALIPRPRSRPALSGGFVFEGKRKSHPYVPGWRGSPYCCFRSRTGRRSLLTAEAQDVTPCSVCLMMTLVLLPVPSDESRSNWAPGIRPHGNRGGLDSSTWVPPFCSCKSIINFICYKLAVWDEIGTF